MKTLYTILTIFFICVFHCGIYGQIPSHVFQKNKNSVHYPLTKEPIDVVIPCVEKDLPILEFCIDGIRKNGENIRRIYIISKTQLTSSAEWVDEKLFPFTQYDLALEIFKDPVQAQQFLQSPNSRIGWIYQQFLKLYAPFVIPNISQNVLILDADTVFLNPVSFLGPNGEGLYNPSTNRFRRFYREHITRVIPWIKKAYNGYSGICHHMLFQRPILEDLFKTIEKEHKTTFWKALCHAIDLKEVYKSCLSEYELYFNFAFSKTNQVQMRMLKWCDTASQDFSTFKINGYDYVSCHSYLRAK